MHIDSDCGRVGPFWWINADTRPRWYRIPGIGDCQFIQEGSCGWGQEARIVLTPIEPFDP